MSAELISKIEEWLKWDKNEETSSYIKTLADSKNYDELSKILLKRLSFGTAGLRGRMAPGYSCMNDLVIIQTGQGLLKYLEEAESNLLKTNGIVVGYDGRHFSRRWAEITASIFIHAGYKVYLYSKVNPTPFVPFAVTKYKCAIGVMVTASHNPKEDNGYKVYASNGTQIISPVDKNIQNLILKNLEPLPTSWDLSVIQTSELCIDPLEEALTDYLKIIDETILPEQKETNKKANILFTYTAMHGVGYEYVAKVFNKIGVKMIPVQEQMHPDPDFPTVKFPNPEEGKSSLNLSFQTANKNNSNVICANDPDADRFAAAEKNTKTQEWKVFTGNELGALLGWWMLHCHKIKDLKTPSDKVYMISSTVSSMILRSMCRKEGLNFVDTLTGFKWMGNKATELQNNGNKVIFAYEESIGYMCGTKVLDKDGVSAAAQFTTMTSYVYSNNQTLVDKLEEIYCTYGQHVSLNSYYFCYDPAKIDEIFKKIRNFDGENKYPSGILNNKYKIQTVRDLTTGYDSNQPDGKATLPVDPKSHMITFNFDNDLVCTLRTSGTEPKIKYYNELCASPEIRDKKTIDDTLKEMVEAICKQFLEPEKNGLIAKSD